MESACFRCKTIWEFQKKKTGRAWEAPAMNATSYPAMREGNLAVSVPFDVFTKGAAEDRAPELYTYPGGERWRSRMGVGWRREGKEYEKVCLFTMHMSTTLDFSAISTCLSMHTSSSHGVVVGTNATPSSPYAFAIDLLHRAFVLPSSHGWVADYLFCPDVLRIEELVSGVQNASASLVDMSVQENGGCAMGRFAAIPMFSKDQVTIGVQIHVGTLFGKLVTLKKCRFVFDNRTCTFLAIESGYANDRIGVTLLTMNPVQGRLFAFMELHAQSFVDLAAKRKISAPLLLNTLMSCTVYQETRLTCSVCGNGYACGCELRTGLPGHPMDFAKFAPNMVLLAGEFVGVRKVWKRSRDGVLVREVEAKSRCRIGVGVDESGVREMCELGIHGIGDVATGGNEAVQSVLRRVRAGERAGKWPKS